MYNRGTYMKTRVMLIAVALAASAVFAQQAPTPRPPAVAGAGKAQFVSPEVQPDRKITFRISARTVSSVQLRFANQDYPMTKGDRGVWSVTVGPVEPEIYQYSFEIGGARVNAGQLEVPGNPPRYDELQDVPHGIIALHTYFGKVENRERNFRVYLPPQYYSEPNRKFPVLYLKNAMDEVQWTTNGRVNNVLDNLIAQKKAVPMVVVMPDNTIPGGHPNGAKPVAAVLIKEFSDEIIPMITKSYRVLTDRNNSAIAGLSYGGGTTFYMGMEHLDMFAYVGLLGTGTFGGLDNPADGSFFAYPPYEPDKLVPGMFKNLVDPGKKLKLFYIAVGEEDPRATATKAAVEDFKKHGIEPVFKTFPGGHEFKFFRRAMADYVTMLFK
jgi:enterochelin esterase-like enzyme